ncbi:long chain fatty alcohol oxidase, putative [Talaromyces stipitatus ATCC 10500]|uniref:Long chain fatty alcohol oxidase, putative n=1 Tax=Talaromyces stipitatus (strain ATCC 10500 / CBS 375.48 / QM 6759 / NRRL 1006) TaxID=441959 RepID=B8M3J8_TALSN|nr:long chain fatty alcohol oxidase, putative [Talaromyces stipitatus ATCC 10500]EED22370.1 long chain fatty alcohol oxidase, putative [Talaromyces stipitatus ATCC 10500]
MTTESYTPLDAPLFLTPHDPVFTDAQWDSLLSLCDVVIPALTTEKSTKSYQKRITTEEFESTLSSITANLKTPDAAQVARQFLEENVSSNPLFKEALRRTFSLYVPQEAKNGLSMILSALNTRAGSLLLTGSLTPVQNQSFDAREKVLNSWLTSRLPQLRQVARSVMLLSKRQWLVNSPTANQIIGFPRVPAYGKPAESFEYEFLQFPPGDGIETIETDVVIVGSGCGGGVAAKNLAEAGHRVIVVEKAYHYPSSYYPMTQSSAFAHMFEQGGNCITDDGYMAVVAGATWGGGGTVNWGASLQTQNYVRQEWADTGLPFFTSSEFQNSMDRVCQRMGVHAEYEQSFQNKITLEGSRKLGYNAQIIPTNSGNQPHYCGHCTLGCHSGGKQGPAVSWLVDAAKAGAVFVEGFNAGKVLFKNVNGKKVASGIQGVWTSRDTHLGTSGRDVTRRKVQITAKKVIVSCGSLQSPLLLMRSGIKSSHLGRHLHLHPVLMASAIFEEETRPWDGDCLTTLVTDFENLDGHGHGLKIENVTMVPSMYLTTFPWFDGLQYKKLAASMNHMAGFITLTRDKDSGRVYPDPISGHPRVDYTISSFDRKHILEGLIAAAKIAYVSGATEFHTSYRDMPPFIRSKTPKTETEDDINNGVNDPEFQFWISEFRKRSPLVAEVGTAASAHQMGTCRMSNSPKNGVVDPDGQVWGTEGLYVADASVFPSASGVNPMVTNMAITDWNSRKLVKVLNRERTFQEKNQQRLALIGYKIIKYQLLAEFRRRPMPSRQFHSKNRHGCIPCKRRRVKCNLARPICRNCARRNKVCISSPGPTSTERNSTRQANMANSQSLIYLLLRNISYITTNDSFSTLRPLNPDLFFLERYFSHICPTLSSRPETQRNWAQAVTDPSQSSKQPHYLTHLQIAISELHFCLIDRDTAITLSERKLYQEQSFYHQNAALSILRPLLASAEEMRTRGLEEVTALFSAAWLIFLFNLTFPRGINSNKEWILNEILELSELSKGVVAVMLGASAGITSSNHSAIEGPVHCKDEDDETRDAKTRVMSGPLRPFFNHLLPWKHEDVPPSVRRQNLSPSAQALFGEIESAEFTTDDTYRKELYRLAIEELELTAVAMKAHTQHPSFIFMWLIGTKREFMELIKRRDEFALKILREYGLMLKTVDGYWWARGLERTTVDGVDSALKSLSGLQCKG